MNGACAPGDRRRAARLIALPVSLIAIAGCAVGARACAVDDVPSLRTDGARVVLNAAVRTLRNGATWAPFVGAHPFPVRHRVRFGEDMAELARSLPPEIMRGRWIWRMGDGAGAQGYTAGHAYRRAGTYLVTVGVRIPDGRIFTFDAAQVRVVASP